MTPTRRWLLGLVVVAACGSTPDHTYPPEVVTRFVESCVKNSPEDTCHCALSAIERAFSVEQFLGFEERIRKGEVPKELADAVNGCR